MSDYTSLFLNNKGAIARAAQVSCPRWMELDDWTSELMLRIWSKIKSYSQSKGKFTTWAYVIAFRFAAQQKQRRLALKRSAHRTKTIYAKRDSGIEVTIEPLDYRAETADSCDRRIDMQSAIEGMISSDREVIESLLSGAKDGEYAKERGFSRQRYNTLRERSLARLHRRLWASYGPKKPGHAV